MYGIGKVGCDTRNGCYKMVTQSLGLACVCICRKTITVYFLAEIVGCPLSQTNTHCSAAAAKIVPPPSVSSTIYRAGWTRPHLPLGSYRLLVNYRDVGSSVTIRKR